MRIILFLLFIGILYPNKYDYLLFSNVYSDVRRGIELGANVNSILRGSTPLYDASRKGNMDIINLLINRGARINDLSHGETALHKVVQVRNLDVANELLKRGANPNIQDGIRGNTTLHYAVFNNDSAMTQLLLSYGADMNIANNKGATVSKFIFQKTNVPSVKTQNDDIALSSSPFRIGGGAVTFNIRNLTNEFVTISHSAVYLNGKLISQAIVDKVIPPNSTASQIGTLPISQDVSKDLNIDSDGIARVQYEFGIEYSIGIRRATLYGGSNINLTVWTAPK